MKVVLFSRTLENIKRSGGSGQLSVTDGGQDVQRIQSTLNLAEIETELRLLRQHVSDERLKRETLASEHTQLIAQIQ